MFNSVITQKAAKTVVSQQRQYWLANLTAEDPKSSILQDFLVPNHTEKYTGTLDFSLSEKAVSGINRITRNERNNKYVFLLSILGILLQKVNAQETVMVGSPVYMLPNQEEVPNRWIVIKNTIAANDSIKTLLPKVQKKVIEAVQNQHYPYEKILEHLQVDSLFDVTVSWKGLHINVKDPLEYGNISLEFSDEGTSQINVKVYFSESLYEANTIHRLFSCLNRLVEKIIEYPDCIVSDITLLTEKEEVILESFNQTERLFSETTITKMFEEQVGKNPEGIALSQGDNFLTYQQLNERANQLAWKLRHKGVRPNDTVGLMTIRSFEMIVGMLAILKAGGAYVPIDPEAPDERKKMMLEDCQTNWLLTHGLNVPSPALEFRGEVFDLGDPTHFTGETTDLPLVAQPSDLVYIIYTSGSTGIPKGVMIEHRALVNRLNWSQKLYPVGTSDVLLQKTVSTFDFSVYEIFGALLYGSCLQLLMPSEEKDPSAICETIEKHKVSFLHFVPSMLNVVLSFLDRSPKNYSFDDVKQIFIGGESLSTIQRDKLIRYFKNAELAHIYGPTEATIDVTYFNCRDWKTENTRKIPIGRPIDNTKLYVLDKEGNIQPIGFPGELHIAGSGLARGYMNRPELTAERFVNNPFIPGTNMYKTGDLARWLPDGNIEFLGRIDQQVKIRGFRIELGEIDNQILKHPEVSAALVTVYTEQESADSLCAYYVAETGITATVLRGHLRNLLPEYMIPTYLIRLDRLPLLSNGKVNRHQLPSPKEKIERTVPFYTTVTRTEQELQVVWANVLGVDPDQIGIDDDFFEIGGHSLRATSLVSQIYKQFGIELSLREVFYMHKTIRDQASFIDQSNSGALATITPVKQMEHYPVSSAQRRLFILQQLDTLGTVYNMPGAIKVEGVVDINRLNRVLEEIIDRHEAFRTRFAFKNGELVQIVMEKATIEIEEENWKGQLNLHVEPFIRPFDLEKGGLLRIKLVKVDETHSFLLIDRHHIISDGVSTNLLLKDFADLYGGKELAPLTLHYKDYATWQQVSLKGEKLQSQKQYWLDEFADEVPVLELPTSFPRPADFKFDGDTHKVKLDRSLAEKLENWSKGKGVTLYMTLLAAYKTLLYRYTGQEDIVVGIPIAGRRHSDLDSIIGMFVNTLAIRSQPSEGKTFASFLQELKEKMLNAYDHQEYPFDELIDELKITTEESRNPLFNTMFSIHERPTTKMEVDGVTLSVFELEQTVAKFDLSVDAIVQDGQLEFIAEYNTHLFEREFIHRFLANFERLLEEVIEYDEQPLGYLEILSNDEKKALHSFARNGTPVFNESEVIHEVFEEIVTKFPNKRALMQGSKEWTYQQLNQRANQLAHTLRDLGVQANSVVGIMVDRSFEMVISILAVLKASGAYLPIDVEAPTSRKQFMLKDSGSKWLLVQDPDQHSLEFDGTTINVEDESVYQRNITNPGMSSSSNDLCYLIYTSGSTGTPKGVMIEHGALANRLNWMKEHYQLGVADRVLQKTVYTFDVSVWEILGSLITGATLVLMEKEEEKNPFALLKAINHYKITHLELIPSYLDALLDFVEEKKEYSLASLKHIFVGSEPVLAHHIEKFRRVIDGYPVRISNTYGPTEATIDVTYYDCTDWRGHHSKNVPIGKPISGMEMYVLNHTLQPQPIGIPGELYIAGKGLARGYRNQPQLTNESFIENPFVPKTSMYKTGDLVKWLADGNLEFLGRLDYQVKIRGHRIELGEIESQLMSHPFISNAIVTVKKEQQGTDALCAYFSAQTVLDTADLKESLSKTLPEYMIPSYFVQLEEMPLLRNGKINRKALPEPHDKLNRQTAYIAPSTEIERQLALIWAEVIGIETDKIGIDDNFFECGGHSLKAMSLIAHIYRKFHVEIPLKAIFNQHKTIRSQAMMISGTEKQEYFAIQPVEDREWYPVSSAQKRLFILQQVNSESTTYNMPGLLEIKGGLDLERVKVAYQQLVERHETLRTHFSFKEGEPVQTISKSAAPMVDIEEANGDVLEQMNSFVQPFDLANELLIRMKVLRVHQEYHYLLFDMHHIISDGISMNILIRDFMAFYRGEAIGNLTIRYRDYAVLQQEKLSSDTLQHQEDYWLKEFSDEVPVLQLPTDYPRNASTGSDGGIYHATISSPVTAGIEKWSNENGVTLYMTLLAAYKTLLYRYTNQEDLVVGTPIAGRNHPELQDIIGMFINTLAIRTQPVGNKSFASFVHEVKEKMLGAYEHQDYPFDQLVDQLDVVNSVDRHPVFDTMFVLQNYDETQLKIDGAEINQVKWRKRTAKVDLTLLISQASNGQLNLEVEYNSHLFKKERIAQFTSHFLQLVENLAQGYALPRLDDWFLLTDAEYRKITGDFTGTALPYDQTATIHEVFEHAVEKNPGAIALEKGNQVMTYEELNQKANSLAHHLRQRGLGTNDLVAIMVDRSFEMLIGILGVLKAGGAYIPIDPDAPLVRKKMILADSQVKWLLNGTEDNVSSYYEGMALNLADQALYNGNTENPSRITTGQDLAYIIYTSGSTGVPKGVMIEHRGVMNILTHTQAHYPVRPGDAYLLKASYTFDLSVPELFGSFVGGGKIVLLEKDQEKNPFNIIDTIEKKQVTHVSFVPSLLQVMLNTVEPEKVKNLGRVKYLIVAGEAVSKKLSSDLKEHIPDTPVINIYGPTETTVYVTNFNVQNDGNQYVTVPIGNAVSNTRLYVMNSIGHLQPIGVPGELYIAGDGVARGYINRPELTAERFVDDPFTTGGRMYKTGDLVRWLHDGNIEFLGRLDHQVKIRGFRIEIGEVENQLLNHEKIAEGLITLKQEADGGKALCAYYISAGDLSTGEVRDYLKSKLPEYMVPAYLVRLDEMPLLPNGKVNRHALPTPMEKVERSRAYIAPETETEKELVSLWEQVLFIDAAQIGVYDNFFESGGHSLKATILVSLVYKHFGIQLPLKDIFAELGTIRSQAGYIDWNGRGEYRAVVTPVEQRGHYPVSSAQKRLVILQNIETESTAYNMPGVYEIKGNVDLEQLKYTFNELAVRHESFRTSLGFVNGEPVQYIQEPELFNIDTEEWNGDLSSHMKEFIRPFDLFKGRLLRVKVIKREENHFYLLVDIHHVISDGLSVERLMTEFTLLYQGEKLEPLALQYKDYAVWQHNHLQTEEMQAQRDFWLKEFSDGEVPMLQLPIEYPRLAGVDSEGAVYRHKMSASLKEQLETWSRSQEVTLYMTMLAAYKTLLHRYTCQEDIIVGTPIAGRRYSELESIIGMFVNTLAIRSQPEAKKSFEAYVQEIKEKMLDVYENQDYPFDELLNDLQIGRGINRHPLFDTMFSFQTQKSENLTMLEVDLAPVEIETSMAKFDLSIDVVRHLDGLEIIAEYDTNLFSKSFIEQFIANYQTLLDSIIKDSSQLLGVMNVVSKEEIKTLEHFSGNISRQAHTAVHTMFEQQAEEHPCKTAVIFNQTEWTYGQLNTRANQLAWTLREKGVTTGTIVGLVADRSYEMIVGMLAILKAGGAYLPIDRSAPETRKRLILEDSGTKLLLLQSSDDQMEGFPGETFLLNDEVIYGQAGDYLPVTVSSSDLAYVLYTSGSTGIPKGVMIEHGAVSNRLRWMKEHYQLGTDDRILQKTVFTFDVSVWEIFGSLISGATMVLMERDEEKNPTTVLRMIQSHGITHIELIPSFLDACLDLVDAGLFEVNSLKHIFIGSEAVLASHVEKFKRVLGNQSIKLSNTYGPTEATIDVTYFECQNWESYGNQNVPIGRPIDNIQLYVLNPDLQRQPIGVPGELYISGAGLARGYVNRSEQTATSFVDNPFEPGTRMYKTSDLVRWLPDGNLEFLGRMDQQVKIRGYRVELGEIENQLLNHPAVSSVLVTVHRETNQSHSLCAYYTGQGKPSASTLQEYLRKSLPDYMIPSYFIHMEVMPLMTNGKISRHELPKPQEKLERFTPYQAPATETEHMVTGIWANVLEMDRDQIGVEDDFFDIGGHSLKVTTLMGRILQTSGVEFTFKDLFNTYKTIRTQAEWIDKQKRRGYLEIHQGERKEFYPLSSAQKRLFLLQQVNPESTAYNMPSVVEIRGNLDLKCVQLAFKGLVNRHDVFRTTFAFKEGEPVQFIMESQPWSLNTVDWRGDIVSHMEDFVRPFNLFKDSLLRVELIRVEDAYHFLLIDMHHIISDGLSSEILMSEFKELYEGRELSPLSLQYRDYAVWQQSHLQSEDLQIQREYWLKEFEDEVPVLQLPTDFARPQVLKPDGAVYHLDVDVSLVKQLEKWSREQGVTLFMTLLAAYKALLCRYTGQEDVVVGIPIAGRRHPDVQSIIGMFVNTLAIRTQPKADKKFGSYVQEVKDKLLNAYEYQDYPFDSLVEELQYSVSENRNPLFDTMFVLQDYGHGPITLEGMDITVPEWENRTSKFDLSFFVSETSVNELEINVEYKLHLFKPTTVARLLNHYVCLLEQIVSEKQEQIMGKMELLSVAEYERVITDFNNKKTLYDDQTSLHGLFEQKVRENPGAIAIDTKHKKITYEELNMHANAVAYHLREQGVQPNDRVALIADRSYEMIVGIFGILKAGGAYVPIDPTAPTKRQMLILADSGAHVLVTQTAYQVPESFNGIRVDLEAYTSGPGIAVNPSVVNRSEDLAYVIYTSGSTGTPKGVMIEHRNVMNLLQSMQMRYPMNAEDAYLFKTSYTFDVSVAELFGWIVSGARLVVLEQGAEKSPDAILKAIGQYSITHVSFVPSLLKVLLDVTEQEELDKLDSLKYLFVAGEAFPLPLAKACRRQLAGVKVINLYGPTESTVYVSEYSLEDMTDDQVTVPIGQPLDNIQFYVLNKQQQPQPIGIPGELYLAGAGLARGYANQPELTAEKFVTNPFNIGTKMYRTGDLAKWTVDGQIEFLGRLDHQVKIRGFRIEIGEIENQLLDHSDITSCLVVAHKGSGEGHASLCAYYVSPSAVTAVEVRQHLHERLPDYMIPSYFVLLEEMPLLPNGKVNRHALPAPEEKLERSGTYVAPMSDLEHQLVQVWSEVLDIPESEIGIDDNFFELGGHSLMILKVLFKGYRYNWNFGIQDFYTHPTIRELDRKTATSEAVVEGKGEVYYDLTHTKMDTQEIVSLNHVLLTGVTGFLGIHLLESLIEETDAKIHCLIRAQSQEEAFNRLFTSIRSYFGKNSYLESLMGKRIFPIVGDVSKAYLGIDKETDNKDIRWDCILHSAANVNHFGKKEEFEKVNVSGTENVLKFAREHKATVHFISTISVAGSSEREDRTFTEREFNIQQSLGNVYVESKYQAEALVYEYRKKAVISSVYRVGNLTGRYHDGKYQLNAGNNAFFSQLQAILSIGSVPDIVVDDRLEFTPVDVCSRAIVRFIKLKANINRTFHLFNDQLISLRDVMETLKEAGQELKVVPADTFNELLIHNAATKDNLQEMSKLMMLNEPSASLKRVPVLGNITKAYLADLKADWPKIDQEYLEKFFKQTDLI